ncbi:uncharacterized protein EI97DRAFT_283504 [Westerdykella ornata]|uniref:Secreted protein n=1 Tax=Westerdykella ornata TaxID=318751 RepID=A0A6A6JN77_WESOR|nr:uncharacterized protein EI97DRAFT_283504 [Westerdykella ornata]KAF2278090.1 hypothetical protein EI97DRAFT_283504 [Westerdykella ornata]
MLHNLALLFLFTLLLTPPAASPFAFRQTGSPKPPKNILKVSDVTVETEADGSGCRPGTVRVAVSEDSSLMTFIFDDFQAAVGPNAGSYRKRALCRVSVTISSPGWAFDVQSVDFRGYVRLGKGVQASIVSRWKWVDMKTGADLKGKGNMQKKVEAPFEEDFLLHKDGETSGEAAVCQKASARFAITLSATLNTDLASPPDSIIQGGSLDNSFKEQMLLGWKNC